MTFHMLVGLIDIDEEDKLFEEDGWTLVYTDEERLKKHFPDSEYVTYELDDLEPALKANLETEIKA